MAIDSVNEINEAADNGTFLQAAFEVIVSNSKNNDTQNVTGVAVDGNGDAVQAVSGNLYVQDDLTLSEGYKAKSIKNTNTVFMKAAANGALEGRPGDHTGIYAHNTYDVNKITDGNLVVNFPGKTLGLVTLAGERSDYTELIVGEKYKFAISNFYAVSAYAVGDTFTVNNGVWKQTASADIPAGEVYAVLVKISYFTEGGMYAGTGYVLEIKRSAAGGGTEVSANPELAGTEPLLTGLQVGDNKYKAPDAVEANPEVPEGTAPTALSGLKIGSNYFSTGGSDQHLYWHSVDISGTFSLGIQSGKSFNAGLIILNTSSEAFTVTTLKPLLLTSGSRFFAIYGAVNMSDSEHIQIRFFSRWSNTEIMATDENGGQSQFTNFTIGTDAVNQIF